ncbi:MAG: sulfatase-like hydrolase/transferase [Chitinophagales bacterium]|nr:sulfatase-like hydrolase/transferase [Chitinophagales bacterium]MDW8427057.1 sulfatase-like hydrolase/transferase [Chitinophagales bacterium]
MRFAFFFCNALLVLALSMFEATAQCSLALPGNVKAKNQTSCSVDISWKAVSGSSYYKVRYRIHGTLTWEYSAELYATSYTVNNLAASTLYEFAVASFCSDGSTQGYSAPVSKETKKCTAPANVTVSAVTVSSATINWTGLCGSTTFTLQYRTQGSSSWNKIKNINSYSYTLTGLTMSSTYEVRLQTNCGSGNSGWTSIIAFTTASNTLPGRNIILYVLDDARYDAFSVNGGPSWFVTPAINSLANEGANFKLSIPTTSQCAPSRASIYTGVYAHVHGVEKNGDAMNSGVPLIQQILKDHGYHTGFVGKYGQYLGDPQGFHWWATSDGNVYENATYRINGVDTLIVGHITDVYQQLAMDFLNSVPAGKRFALFFFTRVPHEPTQPRASDASLYVNEPLPFPSNFSFYTNNYPSFYTSGIWTADSAAVREKILKTFQSLAGAEANVAALLSWLDSKGLKDSTLFVLTSDNGYLMGEHKLKEKVLALEESIRVPLFVRYPKWFAPGTVVTQSISANLDIAVTLLELAGIPNIYGMQGISLRSQAAGSVSRTALFYQTGWDPYYAKLRAVRTLTDIFIRSYCKSTCEEFYDLVADPKQNSNQIFNPSYASVIAMRKVTLDSLRTVYGDYTPTKKTCSLVTTGSRAGMLNAASPDIRLLVFPQPADEQITITVDEIDFTEVALAITDLQGRLLWQGTICAGEPLARIYTASWPAGVYVASATIAGQPVVYRTFVKN